MKILVTGPTFIRPVDIDTFQRHGMQVQRLDPVAATEDQLCEAIAEVDGYVLGGLERVTERVVQAAHKLRGISFTGAGWTEFIPAHSLVTARGIPITSARGANAQAVAELAIALIHERVRHVSYLSGQGRAERIRGRNFRDLCVGIVGAGNVGGKVGRILNAAYGTSVVYASPKRNLDLEAATGARHLALDELLSSVDIVTLHMRRHEGTVGIIGAPQLALMRDGAILINASFADAVKPHALYAELASGRLSAAFDVPLNHFADADLPDFSSLSTRTFIQMGIQAGFNTERTVEVASELATSSMINLLTKGADSWVVNPEYASIAQRGL